MLTFNQKAFTIFIALFLTEVMIAMYVHDAIIRPFFGDFLAVIALYYLLKSFLKFSNLTLVLSSLLFAYFLEILQYFNFLAYSGLKNYKIIAIVLGTSFAWGDIVAYTLGALFVMFSEKQLKNQVTQKIL
jgi:sensor histidine kinase YesM